MVSTKQFGVLGVYRIYLPRQDHVTWTVPICCLKLFRKAKKYLDDHSFYGGILHVHYVPEHETVQDTREKLKQRRKDVARRIKVLGQYYLMQICYILCYSEVYISIIYHMYFPCFKL